MNRTEAKKILKQASLLIDGALADLPTDEALKLTEAFVKSKHAKTMIHYLMVMCCVEWEGSKGEPKRDRRRRMNAFLDVAHWIAVEHFRLNHKKR